MFERILIRIRIQNILTWHFFSFNLKVSGWVQTLGYLALRLLIFIKLVVENFTSFILARVIFNLSISTDFLWEG